MNTIEVSSLSKRYKEFALHNISFDIKRGFITGLIGPNGSGKTTLIKAIMNLIVPDGGEIRIFGEKVQTHEREIKRKIGFVYDESYFYNHLTVSEMKKIIASFYPTWDESLFEQYLLQFQLSRKHKIGDLSKGMKTKFALAAALAHRPELLVMDEPTSGLDPVFRREVLDILSDYIQDEECTVLFSTHITEDLDRIADYIVYIQKGKLHFTGDKEALKETYVLLKGPVSLLTAEMRSLLFGLRETPVGFEGIAKQSDQLIQLFGDRVVFEKPTLDDIIVYTRGESV